jgi:hypothetical protein
VNRPKATFAGTFAALSVVAACALVWTVLPALLLSAPHGDNVEQLNWSGGLQWGYFKHPPFPTWLLRAAIELFGPSATLTYALAMACVALALIGVWLCARQVLEPPGALVALLVSTANYYLMGRGSFLNHNTVMLPFVALSAWSVLRIVRGAGWPIWLMLGLAQALGILTKYQMGLIVIANAVALLSAGVHRQPHFARNAALATAATLLPLIPHSIWLADHQFSSFEYASHSLLAGLGPVERLKSSASFIAQQLARLAPALLALALARGIGTVWRPRTGGQSPPPEPAHACAIRALAIMAVLPIAAIVVLSLAIGVAPQNHWGASSTLLIPLLLVCTIRSAPAPSVGPTAVAVALCHIGAIVWNVVVWQINPGPHHRFAARSLAALAQDHWSSHQSGPLRLVLGPDWEAGSIALYLPGHPAVLPNADPRQAPWIDQDLIARCGALVVGRTDQPLELQLTASQAAAALDRAVLAAWDSRGRESSIQVAVIAPSPGSRCR